jgi:hypothetical protein
MNSEYIFLAVAAFVFLSIACYYMGVPLPITIMMWLLILTCGYIGYDYIRVKRHRKKAACSRQANGATARDINAEINDLLDELDMAEMSSAEHDGPIDMAKEKNNAAVSRKAVQVVDPDSAPLYTNYKDLNHLNYYTGEGLDCSYDFGFAKDYTNYKDMNLMTGCSGDTKLANRAKFQGMKEKFAKDIRARYDRTSSQQYFNDELNTEETRHWYENPDIYDSVM